MDYEFGPFGESAYLESCDISYLSDGLENHKLLSFEVDYQVRKDSAWVYFKDKLTNSRVEVFVNNNRIGSDDMFDNNVKERVKPDNPKIGRAKVLWHDNLICQSKVKSISIKGVWHVNGQLYCSDKIDDVYLINNTSFIKESFKIQLNENFKQKYFSDQTENNFVKVFSDADAVIVKGASPGENIWIYTTSGTLVKSLVSDEDVVNVKLPTNQMYFVFVGEVRYKVVL